MKRRYASYFFLAILLFFTLNLPDSFVGGLRSWVLFAEGRFSVKQEDELLRLRIENRKLKDDLEEVRGWVLLQDRIEGHVKKIEDLTQTRGYSKFYQRRIRDLIALLDKEVLLVEAKVLFRDPAFWSSGFWIDKGERDNRHLGQVVIAKNSPVALGDSLIGVVERVEEKRSYVRLITDSALIPAVRAVRGQEQNRALVQTIDQLEEACTLREGIASEMLLEEMAKMKRVLEQEGETWHLAKGELRGSSYPVWRGRSATLKGVGFNYEFADTEGEARTLHEKGKVPLLQVGDLLVTSGLDGVFPAGMHVGVISKIFPLREGDFAYNIEAKSTAGNLDCVQSVQVFSPL